MQTIQLFFERLNAAQLEAWINPEEHAHNVPCQRPFPTRRQRASTSKHHCQFDQSRLLDVREASPLPSPIRKVGDDALRIHLPRACGQSITVASQASDKRPPRPGGLCNPGILRRGKFLRFSLTCGMLYQRGCPRSTTKAHNICCQRYLWPRQGTNRKAFKMNFCSGADPVPTRNAITSPTASHPTSLRYAALRGLHL